MNPGLGHLPRPVAELIVDRRFRRTEGIQVPPRQLRITPGDQSRGERRPIQLRVLQTHVGSLLHHRTGTRYVTFRLHPHACQVTSKRRVGRLALQQPAGNPLGLFVLPHEPQRDRHVAGGIAQWVQLGCLAEVIHRFRQLALAPLDKAHAREHQRVVGQALCRGRELRQRLVVLEEPPVVVEAPGQARLG